MNALKLLKTSMLAGLVPLFLANPSTAQAGLKETKAEEAALKQKIEALKAKVEAQDARCRKLDRQIEGIPDPSQVLLNDTANSVLRDYRKQLSKAEKSLNSVQAKIAKQSQATGITQDSVKDAARLAAHEATREAAMDAAKDVAKNAAKDVSREVSKNSSKNSSQEAAKSAVSHPPTYCPTTGH